MSEPPSSASGSRALAQARRNLQRLQTLQFALSVLSLALWARYRSLPVFHAVFMQCYMLWMTHSCLRRVARPEAEQPVIVELCGVWPAGWTAQRDLQRWIPPSLMAMGVLLLILLEMPLQLMESLQFGSRTVNSSIQVISMYLSGWLGLLMAWLYWQPWLQSQPRLGITAAGLQFVDYPDSSVPTLIPWQDVLQTEFLMWCPRSATARELRLKVRMRSTRTYFNVRIPESNSEIRSFVEQLKLYTGERCNPSAWRTGLKEPSCDASRDDA